MDLSQDLLSVPEVFFISQQSGTVIKKALILLYSYFTLDLGGGGEMGSLFLLSSSASLLPLL